MLKVDVLDINHWVGLPLMVHFLLCVVNDLNLIDLVLIGLDLPDPDCGISLGKRLLAGIIYPLNIIIKSIFLCVIHISFIYMSCTFDYRVGVRIPKLTSSFLFLLLSHIF